MSPVDPTNLPNGDHVKATEGVIHWLFYLGSLVGIGWASGRKAGKAEAVALDAIKSANEMETKAASFVTQEELKAFQCRCQEHTWDKLLLALEKRDREFDRKFSAICQGISEIKAEVRVQK